MNSVVVPHVSIGIGTVLENTIVSNSIVQHETNIKNAVIANSMIGSKVKYNGLARDLSLGDYTTIDE